MALGGGCIRQVSECGILLERFGSLVGFLVALVFSDALAQLKQKDYKEVLSTKTKAAGELVGDIPCYIAG